MNVESEIKYGRAMNRGYRKTCVSQDLQKKNNPDRRDLKTTKQKTMVSSSTKYFMDTEFMSTKNLF